MSKAKALEFLKERYCFHTPQGRLPSPRALPWYIDKQAMKSRERAAEFRKVMKTFNVCS